MWKQSSSINLVVMVHVYLMNSPTYEGVLNKKSGARSKGLMLNTFGSTLKSFNSLGEVEHKDFVNSS